MDPERWPSTSTKSNVVDEDDLPDSGREIVADLDRGNIAFDDDHGGVVFVPIDEIDITPGVKGRCDHVYLYEGHRVYALEPGAQNGYWTACPACGFLLGQRNLGEVPVSIRRG